MAHRGRKNADDALILALAGGSTIQQAAEQTGLSERTVHRRLADEGFRGRLTSMRADMVERALGRLADSMCEAADTLRELLHADGEAIRLGAARAVLDLGTKLRDAVELESRLEELRRPILGGCLKSTIPQVIAGKG